MKRFFKAGLLWSVILIIICFSAGCGTKPIDEASSNKDRSFGEDDPGQNADGMTGITLPAVKNTGSSIEVDVDGYHPDDMKIAYFAGNELTDTFYVTDALSKKRVFKGSLKKTDRIDDRGRSIWTGDFSDMTSEGAFYLETPVLGQSPRFEVRSGLYDRVIDEQFDMLEKQIMSSGGGSSTGEEDFLDLADAMVVLAEAAMIYPEAFSDSHSLNDMAGVICDRYEQMEDPSVEETCSYITLMCDMDMVYQDTQGSKLYKENAADAWQKLQNTLPAGEQGMTRDEKRSLATASAAMSMTRQELKFISLSEEYLRGCTKIENSDLGTVFQYLSIPKISDVDLCMSLMDKIIRKCTYICEGSASGVLADDQKEESFGINEGVLLSLADHAIVSREYRQKITGIYHELKTEGKLNENAVSLVDRAGLIFMLLQDP